MPGFNTYDQWKTTGPIEEYDDNHCICGAPLDDNPEPDSPHFNGYCSTLCEQGHIVPGGLVRPIYELLRHELGDDPGKWDRAIYKRTECGAWLKIDGLTVTIGSIVEGSDVEISESLTYPFSKEAFWQKVKYVNCEASAIWDEIHYPICGKCNWHHAPFKCPECD